MFGTHSLGWGDSNGNSFDPVRDDTGSWNTEPPLIYPDPWRRMP